MRIDWLEPVIQERTETISESILDDSESYSSIMTLLKSKQAHLSSEFLLELETLIINHTRDVVYLSYKSGVDEALF
ncbi:hypothetical protein P9222_08635 [Paenibacillus amylolyticus]|nr:hypothetical protein [Paenibacillus amylolyticus]WFR64225.1 hypothetical protein P9222_08635 [Paenibacillus amylolyticus]